MKTTKTIQLTDEERNIIYSAIIFTQNQYADMRSSNETFNTYLNERIDKLESLLHKFITSKFDK
jgi:hypothetical protein